jgi:hypothetical protein
MVTARVTDASRLASGHAQQLIEEHSNSITINRSHFGSLSQCMRLFAMVALLKDEAVENHKQLGP